jgi:hypothetical protein
VTAGFPFGHGAPTSIYLGLYLGTWIVHMFLVAVVCGGAAVVGFDAWRGGDPGSPRRRAAAPLRDLLPLVLGLAITAGVAPLLFVQILYREAFYTAHLLQVGRALAILPALLGCFYLLYLGKGDRGRWARVAIYAAAGAAALFIGYSFAELHTVALEPETWVERYAAAEVPGAAGAPLRFFAFLGLAAALTPVAAAWLLRWRGDPGAEAALAVPAIAGWIAAAAAVVLYGRGLPEDAAAAVAHPSVRMQLAVAAVAAAVAATAWGRVAARPAASHRALPLATAASGIALWGLAVAREAVRAARLDLETLAPLHRNAAESGGGLAFAAFAVVNAALIGWCITRLDRARRL